MEKCMRSAEWGINFKGFQTDEFQRGKSFTLHEFDESIPG